MNFNNIHSEQVQFFESLLFECLGAEISVESYRFLSGGNINTAVRLETEEGYFFLKWNEQQTEDLFSCEAKGLNLLSQTNVVKVPEVLGFGKKGDKSYILLEFLSLTEPTDQYWQNLGRSLASLHTYTTSQFGLSYTNYIGSLLQQNSFTDNWTDFFIQNRIRPQAGLAFYNNEISKDFLHRIERFCNKLPDLLPVTTPSLLHGDLWSGNVLTGDFQEPIFIDPSVYYGCREAEIAFTKLFGGFDDIFYESYNECFPLDAGFEERIGIYNMYPLLVHVNLFGAGGYIAGVEKVLRRFGC
jgi:fructosamine-3-kinase